MPGTGFYVQDFIQVPDDGWNDVNRALRYIWETFDDLNRRMGVVENSYITQAAATRQFSPDVIRQTLINENKYSITNNFPFGDGVRIITGTLQPTDQRPTNLGRADKDRVLFYATDVDYLLRWTGTAWLAINYASGSIVAFESAPTSNGWKLCNGVGTVDVMQPNGSFITIAVPLLTGGTYLKMGSSYSGPSPTAATSPTLSGSPALSGSPSLTGSPALDGDATVSIGDPTLTGSITGSNTRPTIASGAITGTVAPPTIASGGVTGTVAPPTIASGGVTGTVAPPTIASGTIFGGNTSPHIVSGGITGTIDDATTMAGGPWTPSGDVGGDVAMTDHLHSFDTLAVVDGPVNSSNHAIGWAPSGTSGNHVHGLTALDTGVVDTNDADVIHSHPMGGMSTFDTSLPSGYSGVKSGSDFLAATDSHSHDTFSTYSWGTDDSTSLETDHHHAYQINFSGFSSDYTNPTWTNSSVSHTHSLAGSTTAGIGDGPITIPLSPGAYWARDDASFSHKHAWSYDSQNFGFSAPVWSYTSNTFIFNAPIWSYTSNTFIFNAPIWSYTSNTFIFNAPIWSYDGNLGATNPAPVWSIGTLIATIGSLAATIGTLAVSAGTLSIGSDGEPQHMTVLPYLRR